MQYQEAIGNVLSLFDSERARVDGPRQKVIYDLGRMEELLQRMGNPHRRVPTVHIAGTKGKGSTAALCDAAFHAAGLGTGFYSSPHLHTFRERFDYSLKKFAFDSALITHRESHHELSVEYLRFCNSRNSPVPQRYLPRWDLRSRLKGLLPWIRDSEQLQCNLLVLLD